MAEKCDKYGIKGFPLSGQKIARGSGSLFIRVREDVFAKSAAVQSPASEAIVITRREEEALPVTEQHFVSDLVRDFYHAAA